jgi:formylglycine-generating enzyme required for sulfatase activity
MEIMGTDPSSTSKSNGTDDPVQKVNWYHAIAFCNKLSIAEGLEPVYAVYGVDFDTLTYADIPISGHSRWNATTAYWGNNGYRLPTEMEWMWAAMGATSDRTFGYSGSGTNTTGYRKGYAGSTEGATQANLESYAWTDSNSDNKSHPVGTKYPNELGLYDMSGNVWEWCWDWYDEYPSGSGTDYKGPSPNVSRVIRGGSWYYVSSYYTVADRDFDNPGSRYNNYGFRVVLP